MIYSYHVHSKWSDGEDSIEDIVRAAGERGFWEIGISDHYVLIPRGEQVSWSMPLDKLDEYVESVQIASGGAMDGLTVRLGVEADFIPEMAEDLGYVLSSQPFDYVIGAVHILDGFSIDESAGDWGPLAQRERNDIIRMYWARILQMARSGLFDIAAHIDLYKKFGSRPSVDISNDVSAALDAIAVARMSVEFSTAGWYKPCREAYPSMSILHECRKRNIPIMVTADAHSVNDLTRGYERAYPLVEELGYTEVVSYAGRQVQIRSISDQPV